jgi:hypothetical protein
MQGGGALESRTVLNTKEKSGSELWRRRRPLLWCFVAAVIATHVFFLWRVRDQIVRGDPDFTVFYTAGKMLREGRGGELYSSRAQLAVQGEFARNQEIRRGPLPYIHPPFEALFFLPLTLLAYPYAFVLWNLINIAILFGVGTLLRSSLSSLGKIPVWQMVVLSLAFFPIFANFHQGQDAILLLLVVSLSFRALDRGADVLGGGWLALGLFKYHLILPLAVILAVWRGTRFIAGFATMSAGVVLVSLGLVGWNGALQYPTYAWRVISGPAFGGIPPRQLPSIFGLLAGWPIFERIGLAVQVAVAVASCGVLVMAASLRKWAQCKEFSGLCFAVAVIAAVLVAYSTNTYDLSLLMLPLAVVANYSLAGPRNVRGLLAPAIPLLVSPLWFFLWMRWERINVMAVFLLWWLIALFAEVRRLGNAADAASHESPVIANV